MPRNEMMLITDAAGLLNSDGIRERVHRKRPRKFTANTRSQSSSVTSSSRLGIDATPALLTRTSSRPVAEAARAVNGFDGAFVRYVDLDGVSQLAAADDGLDDLVKCRHVNVSADHRRALLGKCICETPAETKARTGHKYNAICQVKRIHHRFAPVFGWVRSLLYEATVR